MPKSLMYSDTNTDDNDDEFIDIDTLVTMPFRMVSIGEDVDESNDLQAPADGQEMQETTIHTELTYDGLDVANYSCVPGRDGPPGLEPPNVALLPPFAESSSCSMSSNVRKPVGLETDTSFLNWRAQSLQHSGSSTYPFACVSCPSSPWACPSQPSGDTLFSRSWPSSARDDQSLFKSETVFDACAHAKDKERERGSPFARPVPADVMINDTFSLDHPVFSRQTSGASSSASSSSPWPHVAVWPRTPDFSPMSSFTLPPSLQLVMPAGQADTELCGQLHKQNSGFGAVGTASSTKEHSSCPPLPPISSAVDLKKLASGAVSHSEEKYKIVYVPIILPHRCTHCGHECTGPPQSAVQAFVGASGVYKMEDLA